MVPYQQSILSAENIIKNYPTSAGELRVLRGLNLKVEEGEIVALVGASGVGKSTLLHIFGALDRPTSGKVYYRGTDIFSLPDKSLAPFRNRAVGFIFQLHHLLREFSALENVMMPALIAGTNNGKAQKRASELLERVGLKERLNHRPGELSGGEQQKVALARALVNTPQIVLADEPSGNLDKEGGEMLYSLFLELNRDMDQTFIIATHNLELAGKAKRVLRLEEGVLN
ncbi:MAG: ABC transporter ATP-binding protein [Candidatus Zixiibacteriota bacterium]|nr:MAG: ABC transporter ATP-binding protein [candidate division Zixibacteria bacterium]